MSDTRLSFQNEETSTVKSFLSLYNWWLFEIHISEGNLILFILIAYLYLSGLLLDVDLRTNNDKTFVYK